LEDVGNKQDNEKYLKDEELKKKIPKTLQMNQLDKLDPLV
jgi:hypothetical protein